MNDKEREELKLEVLTTICEKNGFSLDETFPSVNVLHELLPGKDFDKLREAVLELGSEGCLSSKKQPSSGGILPYDIKLTQKGRAFIESRQTQ